MMLSRHETTETRAKLILVFAFFSALYLGFVSLHFSGKFFHMILLRVSVFCFLFDVILAISAMAYLSANYHVKKLGFKKAVELYRLKQLISHGLVEARVYFQTSTESLVSVPKISLDLKNDVLIVRIQNSIRFAKQLDSIDISSVLPTNLIIENSYFDKGQNWRIFEVSSLSENDRLLIHSFENFKAETAKYGRYELFVDSKLTLDFGHFLIVGKTGSGKTYFMFSLLLQALLKDCKIYVIDPKNSDLAQIGKLVGHFGTDIESTLGLLNDFRTVINDRKKTLKELSSGDLARDYRAYDLKPILLVFDEYAAFISRLSSKPKSVRDKVSEVVDTVVFEGRQLGIFLICGMQKSDASTFPTRLRDNMMFRCVLGNSEQTTLVTTFGYENIPKILMELGQGLYMTSKTNVPKFINTPTLDFDIYNSFLSIKK